MNRPITALTLTVLCCAILAPGARATAPAVSDAAGRYLPPGPEEVARVKEKFRDAAARTAGERSGTLFFLPTKYNYVAGGGYRVTAHLAGKPFETRGTVHGNSWEYDTHIPIVLWGPGFVKPGVRSEQLATQQDLVPTYAALMGTPPPADAFGRVLREGLIGTTRRPKVVVTVLFDQGGEVYYRAHPGATPNIDRLKREGAYFTQAYVTHLDVETGIGHTGVGTGAWPAQTGICSNDFWLRALGSSRYSFNGETPASPIWQQSPSLGDVWLRRTNNQALLAAYCYADRAAIGMGGHGSLYQGNKKPYVFFYDEKAGKLTTNEAYYALPPYLAGRSPAPYLEKLTKGTGRWMDHPVDPKSTVRSTPAFATFDGDNIVRLIEAEPWGERGVTDLLFVTFKCTDAAGHTYGHESDEAGAVLAEQDKQVGRVIEAMAAKVGRDNLVVAISADHGSTPLVELSGGTALLEDRLVADLNARLDQQDNGVDLVDYVSATQLWVDDAERLRNHLSWEAIKKAVLDYQVDGKPFFVDAFTRDEALARSAKFAPAP